MSNRLRSTRIQFRVTDKEKELIQKNMDRLGTKNMEAYLRKMAIDGYILQLDTSDVRELVKVLRITSNSLNQMVKHAHLTGNIYRDEVDDLKKSYDNLWDFAKKIMFKLSKL